MTDLGGITYDLLAQRFQNAPEYEKIWNQFMDVRFLLNGFKELPPLVERNCNEAAAAVMSAPAKLFLKMLITISHHAPKMQWDASKRLVIFR